MLHKIYIELDKTFGWSNAIVARKICDLKELVQYKWCSAVISRKFAQCWVFVCLFVCVCMCVCVCGYIYIYLLILRMQCGFSGIWLETWNNSITWCMVCSCVLRIPQNNSIIPQFCKGKSLSLLVKTKGKELISGWKLGTITSLPNLTRYFAFGKGEGWVVGLWQQEDWYIRSNTKREVSKSHWSKL